MAILRVNNEKTSIEIPFVIPNAELKVKPNNDYSVNESGLITQQILVTAHLGSQKISFPIAFPTTCNTVFIGEEIDIEIRSSISFSNITRNGFTMTTRPNKYQNIGIKIYATGY